MLHCITLLTRKLKVTHHRSNCLLSFFLFGWSWCQFFPFHFRKHHLIPCFHLHLSLVFFKHLSFFYQANFQVNICWGLLEMYGAIMQVNVNCQIRIYDSFMLKSRFFVCINFFIPVSHPAHFMQTGGGKLKALVIEYQRWSRGHNVWGQGLKNSKAKDQLFEGRPFRGREQELKIIVRIFSIIFFKLWWVNFLLFFSAKVLKILHFVKFFMIIR